MDILSERWTKEYREAERTKELKRLNTIFKDMPEDKKKTVVGLLENAAFQRVALTELQDQLNQSGYIETYQNGENQKGLKKSSFAEVYDKYLNTYSKIIKQLTDLIDKVNDSSVPGAEIMSFLKK